MEKKKLMANICTNEIVFNESAEIPIDIEFTLPDYLPDINRILKCKAVSRVSSKGLNGSQAFVDGAVTVTVIFTDESNKIFCYEYQYPFNKTFDIGADTENIIVKCNSKCEYINCRAVSGRKIDIHGATLVIMKVVKKKVSDILTDFDDCDIEINRISVPSTTPMEYSEKYLILEEEIEIGGGMPPICNLMRYDATAITKECKMLDKKMVIKGELCVSAFYTSNDGNFQKHKTSVPFSQILDMPNLNSECECDTSIEVAYLEIKPKTSSSGEIKCLILNAKLLIRCEAHCNNDVEIAIDAFSKQHEAKISKNNIKINKLCKNIRENFTCKKNLEFTGNTFSVITDLWTDIQNINYKFENENLCIFGVVTVGVLGCDENLIPIFSEKNIDFEYKYPFPESAIKDVYCEPSAEIVSCNYTLTGNSTIEVRIELAINTPVYCGINVTAITDIDIDASTVLSRDKFGALTVYFANSGESVWDIAMRYYASVNEIKQINNLTDDTLKSDKMLVIPVA